MISLRTAHSTNNSRFGGHHKLIVTPYYSKNAIHFFVPGLILKAGTTYVNTFMLSARYRSVSCKSFSLFVSGVKAKTPFQGAPARQFFYFPFLVSLYFVIHFYSSNIIPAEFKEGFGNGFQCLYEIYFTLSFVCL